MVEKLLVIDDDEAICRFVNALFQPEGFHVLAEHDGASGLERASVEQPHVVLLDLQLPDVQGLEVLEKLRTKAPHVPVVMFTGSHDVKNAVRAIQLGAFDYLTKPIHKDELLIVVRRALESQRLQLEVQELRRQVGKPGSTNLESLMGPGPHVKRVVDAVRLVAASNFTVLLLGETGTGKELVARTLHELSGRHRHPFVALDCGAIPESLLESELFGHEKGAFTGAERRREGRFRMAEGGTCFLDEVGNLPTPLQAKLLRVLESRQVYAVGAERATPMDVRFVAATNEDLPERVARGLFRSDLYFRLAQYTISLPALRDRVEDVAYLTQRFVEEVGIELRRPIQAIVPEAIDLLRAYRWPGNVRELRNVVRQAVLQTTGLAVRAEAVRAVLDQLETTGPAPALARAPDQSLKEVATAAAAAAERQAICETLRATGGNKSRAAKLLKTDYKTLHTKIKQFGIRAIDFSS